MSRGQGAKRAAWALALLAAGCHGTGQRSEPKSVLEKGLFFEERTESGGAEPISAKQGSKETAERPAEPVPEPPTGDPGSGGAAEPPQAGKREVERNASGATVDVNSTVHIELLRDELGTPSNLPVSKELLQRAEALRDAVSVFAGLQERLEKASRSWEELNAAPQSARESRLAAFNADKRAHAERVIEVLGTIRELWPKSHERRGDLEDLVDRLDAEDTTPERRDAAAREFERVLAERIAELAPEVEGELEAFEDKAEAEIERRKLVIEAFVVPHDAPDKAHAVHVEGYDDLAAGSVVRIDGKGLTLTQSEREYLLELTAASKELAEALEKVRRGEATLAEAFAMAKTEFGKKLAAKLQEFESLKDDLGKAKLEALRDETRTAFEALLEKWGQRLRDKLDQDPETSLSAFPAWASTLGRATALVDEIEKLRERWRSPASADLPQLVLDSVDAAAKLARFVSDLVVGGQASALLDDLQAFLEDPTSGLTAEEKQAFKTDLEPLKAALAKWKGLWDRVRSFLDDARAILLGPPPAPPPGLDLENPQAFRVDLDVAPDAEIDLRTTTRKAGDYLVVKARLLDGDAKVDTLQSTLRVEKLGWHASLVPSVVYVTADRVSGEDDSGGFSASLGWMWSYGPRDDEDDPFLSRSLGWSAGIHAVLLSFAPDNDAEVGLGASLGLWDGRIQLGTGYNIFAEDSGDGAWYYYIGSSLIPLLQALDSD